MTIIKSIDKPARYGIEIGADQALASGRFSLSLSLSLSRSAIGKWAGRGGGGGGRRSAGSASNASVWGHTRVVVASGGAITERASELERKTLREGEQSMTSLGEREREREKEMER